MSSETQACQSSEASMNGETENGIAPSLTTTSPAVSEATKVQSSEAPLNEGTKNGKDILPTDVNVSDILKILVTGGLKLIPEVGGILSGLVGLLWPASGQSTWDQVKEEVEKMINEKIDQAIFSLLKAKLDGLGQNLRLYVGLVATGASGETIRMQFISTNTLFVAAAPEYKNPDYQWTLGPLFAMFAQLHISLLRDCVLHGKAWDWPSEKDFQYYVDLTQPTLKSYIDYIDKVLKDRRAFLQRNVPTSPDQHRTVIYNYWQPFNQQSVVAFDDYRLLLVYLDPVAYPGPTTRIPFAEAYSRAYGTADNWDATANAMSSGGGVTAPYGAPLTMIDSIYVELFNYGPRVLNVQHKSDGPQVKGGNRVDQYGIINNRRGGVEKQTITFTPVEGRDFVIQRVSLKYQSIPLTLDLYLYDGKLIRVYDKIPIGGGSWDSISVEGRMLTTLNMWTLSKFYDDNLGCIIFGFNRDQKYVPPQVRDLLYVTSIHKPKDNRAGTSKMVLDKERTAYWDGLNRLVDEKSTG